MQIVNSQNFNQEVINASFDAPVIVDFFSNRCGPCQAMKPLLNAMVADGYNIVGVNIDESYDVAAHFEIAAMPTFVSFRYGEPVYKLVGMQDREKLIQLHEASNRAAA